MRRPICKVARLSEWHRIKREHPEGAVVEATAVRHAGFGALCEVGKGATRRSFAPAKEPAQSLMGIADLCEGDHGIPRHGLPRGLADVRPEGSQEPCSMRSQSTL